jgi:hypothetical protein
MLNVVMLNVIMLNAIIQSVFMLNVVAPQNDVFFNTGLLNKSSHLAPALGVTKFIIVIEKILATLYCATSVGLSCSTNRPLRWVC